MSDRHFRHSVATMRAPQLGLVVLQADESIEPDMRRLLAPDTELLVTRTPSGDEVTPETLAAMEGHLGSSAALLPPAAIFSSLGYACTSGAAQIGPERVSQILREATGAAHVTNPISALLAACAALGVTRLGLISPYVTAVSDRIRTVLGQAGVSTPAFGSFNVAEEARVVRIDGASIQAATMALAAEGGIDGLFLSCTNLRTLDLIAPLEEATGLPILSSNQVLAWHMVRQAGLHLSPGPWGSLATSALADAV